MFEKRLVRSATDFRNVYLNYLTNPSQSDCIFLYNSITISRVLQKLLVN